MEKMEKYLNLNEAYFFLFGNSGANPLSSLYNTLSYPSMLLFDKDRLAISGVSRRCARA